MNQIDNDKIKQLTSHKIAYQIYEREVMMKHRKVKKIIISLLVIGLLSGGIGVVDGYNNQVVSKKVKQVINVLLQDEKGVREINGEYFRDSNGDIWIKYQSENEELEFNQSELEKNEMEAKGKINSQDNEASIEINE